MDLHDKWLKTREISQGCAFWGFKPKILPTLYCPQIAKFSLRESCFRLTTRINLGESATKLRS